MDYLAFLQKEIHAAAFATLAEDGRPEARIIDVMLYDGKSLYFLTAKGKEFYRQLIEQKFVAVTGQKDGKAVSLRGFVRVADPALLDVMFEENPYMKDIYPGDTRRALEAFEIYQASGEYFDLTQTPVLREPIAIGAGESATGRCYRITAGCTACGRCMPVCPQRCIEPGRPYRIAPEHCLHCGACAAVCPAGAVVF